ncbi:MAG: hypothetical protein AAFS10_19660 [Myxococcota bacterium]
MQTIAQLIHPNRADVPQPSPGTITLPSWSLHWNDAGVTFYDLETQERHHPQPTEPIFVQATRAQHTNTTPRMTGMLFGGNTTQWLNVELRHITLGRIRLAAQVTEPALLEGLEYLELPAPEVPLKQLTALLQALTCRNAIRPVRAPTNPSQAPKTPRPRPLPSDSVDRHTFERLAGQLMALKATLADTRVQRDDTQEGLAQATSHAASYAQQLQEAQIEIANLRAEQEIIKAQHHADMSALKIELQLYRAEQEASQGQRVGSAPVATRNDAITEQERRQHASEVAALRQELKLSEANYDKLNEEFLDALETIEALEDALGV